MDINEIGDYGGKYFAAKDFGSEPQQFVIEGWELVAFKDGSEKVALELEGQKRKLVLNKTNARNLERGTDTSDVDDWVGTTIKVVAFDGTFAGKPVKSVCVTAVEAQF